VNASYLLQKTTPVYAIGLTGGGYIYFRSSKQPLVFTSSTHAEMRAIYTLVKDLLFLIYLCYELRVELHLPALIFEGNSAVVTVTTEENAYAYQAQPFYLNLQPEAGGAVHREGDLHGYEEQGGSSDSHLGSHRRIQS
jgi:hypothetical protein